MKLKKKKLAD
jgi:hypothetical protein